MLLQNDKKKKNGQLLHKTNMYFHTLLAVSPHAAFYHLAVFPTETQLLRYLDNVHQCCRRFASATGRTALYDANPEATERFPNNA